MPLEAFDSFYEKYSDKSNEVFIKLETIIKNPAPSHVPLNEVMKKAGSLL